MKHFRLILTLAIVLTMFGSAAHDILRDCDDNFICEHEFGFPLRFIYYNDVQEPLFYTAAMVFIPLMLNGLIWFIALSLGFVLLKFRK